MIFGSLMYMAEGGEDLKTFNLGGRWNDDTKVYERKVGRQWTGSYWNPVWEESPFQSIPHAFWWAMVTATTVGYGDDYPTTTLGYIVGTATMVFSMVILALPVGVMGGTFSQEWEKYELEKKEKAEIVEREMAFITRAIKKLDPKKIAPLILVEVWHSHPGLRTPSDQRPPAATFLGKATFAIKVPPNQSVTEEFNLSLEDNPSIVKRRVAGRVRVKYEWDPGLEPLKRSGTNSKLSLPAFNSEGVAEDFNIQGKLRVTLVSAEKLINLDCNGAYVNPYCTVLCFPSYSRSKGGPQYNIWRTPVVRNKLNPQWNARHIFTFNWVPVRKTQAGASPGRESTASSDSLVKASQLDQVLRLLYDVAGELKQQRGSLKHVREDVRTVAGRVDQLTMVHNASAAAVHMS